MNPPIADVRLVVLDVVGTTVAGAAQIPDAFREAFRAYGLAVTDADLDELRGRSKREAITRLLDAAGHTDPQLGTQIHDAFHDILARLYRSGPVAPIPGAAETLAWLRQRGIKAALTTGLDRPALRILLERIGWNEEIVDAVVCADDVPRGRPAPYVIFHAMERTGITDVRRVAVVGDTTADLDAAHNAGVTLAFGVQSGAHSAEMLATRPHTRILDSVADLPSLWLDAGDAATVPPHRFDFTALPWQTPMVGVRAKVARHGATQLRLAEYGPDMPPHWCERPHSGWILEGRFAIEFPEETVVYSAGDGIAIPPGPQYRHRARVVEGPVLAVFVEPIPDA